MRPQLALLFASLSLAVGCDRPLLSEADFADTRQHLAQGSDDASATDSGSADVEDAGAQDDADAAEDVSTAPDVPLDSIGVDVDDVVVADVDDVVLADATEDGQSLSDVVPFDSESDSADSYQPNSDAQDVEVTDAPPSSGGVVDQETCKKLGMAFVEVKLDLSCFDLTKINGPGAGVSCAELPCVTVTSDQTDFKPVPLSLGPSSAATVWGCVKPGSALVYKFQVDGVDEGLSDGVDFVKTVGTATYRNYAVPPGTAAGTKLSTTHAFSQNLRCTKLKEADKETYQKKKQSLYVPLTEPLVPLHFEVTTCDTKAVVGFAVRPKGGSASDEVMLKAASVGSKVYVGTAFLTATEAQSYEFEVYRYAAGGATQEGNEGFSKTGLKCVSVDKTSMKWIRKVNATEERVVRVSYGSCKYSCKAWVEPPFSARVFVDMSCAKSFGGKGFPGFNPGAHTLALRAVKAGVTYPCVMASDLKDEGNYGLWGYTYACSIADKKAALNINHADYHLTYGPKGGDLNSYPELHAGTYCYSALGAKCADPKAYACAANGGPTACAQCPWQTFDGSGYRQLKPEPGVTKLRRVAFGSCGPCPYATP